MVRIRLRRIGLKGQPTYRIIAADKESPRDGRFLEILGVYNPRTNPATIHIKEDRVFHWMKNGALPTESVAQIFKSAGTQLRFDRFKKGEAIETLLAEAAEAEDQARRSHQDTQRLISYVIARAHFATKQSPTTETASARERLAMTWIGIL